MYVSLAEAARLLGWDKRKTLRWLLAERAAAKISGRWFTTAAQMRLLFPEAARPRRSARVPERDYLTVSDVAKLLGWTKSKTMRWLKKEQAGERGGMLVWAFNRWVTTKERLRMAYPDIMLGFFENE